MDMDIIIDNLSLQVDVDRLHKHLHIEPGTDDATRLQELVREAQDIASPKVALRTVYIENRGDDYVSIDGIRFDSRVLSVNLKDSYRVFPFVATGGRELETWVKSIGDFVEQFWADAIFRHALETAVSAFDRYMKDSFPGKTAIMNPGSLPDWPLREQTKLFQLLTDLPTKIGVTLTDSFLMVPAKSLSGIRFHTETDFKNCQLCPRERCPGRRAPYDRELFTSKYSQDA